MVRDILAAASGAVEDKLYPEDVFVSYLRTGTGAEVTITTGIDYIKGFMTWTKDRSGATDHAIYDSARGVTKDLASNSTAAETTQTTGLKSVSTTGHTIGSLAKMNTSGATYVDWVFRKAPKFFDVVTYTGNGVAGRQIPHGLGITPGFILFKRIDISENWGVYHKNMPANTSARINSNSLFGVDQSVLIPSVGINSFTVSNSQWNSDGTNTINTVGGQYVAYLFAHDTSADGIIQCGSFTTDASGNATVNLGWEPQYVLIKNSTGTAYDWIVTDSMRGSKAGYDSTFTGAKLSPNTSGAEGQNTMSSVFTSTGFAQANMYTLTTYIYLAIRRPMKVPTSGTEVYSSITGTSVSGGKTEALSFTPDAIFGKYVRTLNGHPNYFYDRLRGGNHFLASNSTDAEGTNDTYRVYFDNSSSIKDNVFASGGGLTTGYTYSSYFFKRAKGFFDIVCYTGTGVARTVNHNLGVVPELIIHKGRSVDGLWCVYSSSLGATKGLYLNQNYGLDTIGQTHPAWNNTAPTDSVFTVGTLSTHVNGSGSTYVTYLFASLPGISKIFSYVGNGTSQTINCGFSTGARFVMCKAVSTTGNWNIGDSVRGLTSGNDPLLSLNTTAAEVTTDDWLDPSAEGFIVNETASAHANTNGVQYVFLAIA